MTLSIEVLPAPFGPMMARISPLRMSKETSVIALHAAEGKRHVLDRQQHVAGRDALVRPGALMPPSSRSPAAATGWIFHVADLDAGGDDALAAVLERDLGADAASVRAVVERRRSAAHSVRR